MRQMLGAQGCPSHSGLGATGVRWECLAANEGGWGSGRGENMRSHFFLVYLKCTKKKPVAFKKTPTPPHPTKVQRLGCSKKKCPGALVEKFQSWP